MAQAGHGSSLMGKNPGAGGTGGAAARAVAGKQLISAPESSAEEGWQRGKVADKLSLGITTFCSSNKPLHIWTKTMTCKNPAGRPGCAQPPRYVAGAENPGTRRWSDRCKAQS